MFNLLNDKLCLIAHIRNRLIVICDRINAGIHIYFVLGVTKLLPHLCDTLINEFLFKILLSCQNCKFIIRNPSVYRAGTADRAEDGSFPLQYIVSHLSSKQFVVKLKAINITDNEKIIGVGVFAQLLLDRLEKISLTVYAGQLVMGHLIKSFPARMYLLGNIVKFKGVSDNFFACKQTADHDIVDGGAAICQNRSFLIRHIVAAGAYHFGKRFMKQLM